MAWVAPHELHVIQAAGHRGCIRLGGSCDLISSDHTPERDVGYSRQHLVVHYEAFSEFLMFQCRIVIASAIAAAPVQRTCQPLANKVIQGVLYVLEKTGVPDLVRGQMASVSAGGPGAVVRVQGPFADAMMGKAKTLAGYEDAELVTGERDGVWLHHGLSPLGREVIGMSFQ